MFTIYRGIPVGDQAPAGDRQEITDEWFLPRDSIEERVESLPGPSDELELTDQSSGSSSPSCGFEDSDLHLGRTLRLCHLTDFILGSSFRSI